MSKLIILLITEFLEGYLDTFGDKLLNVVSIALYPEKVMSSMNVGGFDDVSKIFLEFGISMIVLKFLKKGFETYILWTDGDPDAEPVGLLINFFRAMAIALCFGVMYGWLANIIIDGTDRVLNAIGLSTDIDFSSLLARIVNGRIFYAVFTLVFFIVYLILYIQFIGKGIQMLMLRIGLPLACVGLMDADKGVFKTYIQKLLQVSLTLLVQVVLTKLAFTFMMGGDSLWGLAALIMGIRTPRFLQEFLVLPEGNGISNIYSGARIFQMLKFAAR